MSEPFVARFVVWKRLLAILGCAGFVLLGLWIAGMVGGIDDPQPVMGWLSVAVFGGFGLIGLRRLAVTGDAIRIDGAGIWLWRANGGVTIPWAAIRRVGVRHVRRQRFLCLWLDDPDRYRAPGLLGAVRANSAMGFGDISLGTTGTDRGFVELEEAAARFAPAHLLD